MKSANSLGQGQIEQLNFEEAYERLNDTASKLERGNLSLEESLTLYEEGVLLSQYCDKLLDSAELRITQIIASPAADTNEDKEEDLGW